MSRLDIVICSLPFIEYYLPPAAPAVLKGHLESRGFTAKSHYILTYEPTGRTLLRRQTTNDDAFTQSYDHAFGLHVVFCAHEQPPAIHDGQLKLLQPPPPPRILAVQPGHAWAELPYLQNAQRMRTTVMFAR